MGGQNSKSKYCFQHASINIIIKKSNFRPGDLIEGVVQL